MSLATFKGGTHPYEGKELAEGSAIRKLDFEGNFFFPLSQGIGAPAKPVVAAGDHVKAGQIIAEAGGFVSANVLSSVSGTVKAIEPRMTANGLDSPCIVVESDGLYETAEGVGEKRDYTKLSGEEIIDIVKKAGIVGIGGAGFPTHVKLSPRFPEKVDYIIANGSECEPMLTSDYRLMLEEPEKLLGGMKVCLQIFPQAKGIIAIENNKPEAIKAVKEICAHEPNVEVVELKTKYPEGGERQLIYAVTGRTINSGVLPADAGCIVNNVATLAAIYDAVVNGIPLMEKVIT
ncbi:MAG: RnfABCDGE type electron transport complex subunit C, partial [Lachnospiraceae bacterium]|nr:RnfABCDGE type electron transport complex subunit C [Candidatus Hippenecus merdae]